MIGLLWNKSNLIVNIARSDMAQHCPCQDIWRFYIQTFTPYGLAGPGKAREDLAGQHSPKLVRSALKTNWKTIHFGTPDSNLNIQFSRILHFRTPEWPKSLLWCNLESEIWKSPILPNTRLVKPLALCKCDHENWLTSKLANNPNGQILTVV